MYMANNLISEKTVSIDGWNDKVSKKINCLS